MMAAQSFGILFGVALVLGTSLVEGKWRGGRLLHPR